MQHLDEGQLMALLDRELTGTELQDAELHLQSCSDCSARLAELKGFMQEADGLVSDLGEPPALSPAPVAPPIERRARRRFSPRTLAWAASIVAALGLGFVSSQWLGIKRTADYAAEPTEGAVEPSAVSTPTAAPLPAAPEVALGQQQGQPSISGNAAGEGPANEANQALAVAPNALLSSEADELRPNVGEVAGRGAFTTDSTLGDVAAGRDNPAPPAQASAKVADQFARADRPAREEASTAERRMAAAPANGAGFRQRSQPAPVFQPVTMEEAVRHLSGLIRLIDGLTPEEFSLAAADSTHPLVRVIYRVGPAETRLVLEQRRLDNSFVASDLQAPTLSVAPGSAGNILTWNDLQGFALRLAGRFSSDSLFHFKTLVK
jgi:anti-sigma factor RsiW